MRLSHPRTHAPPTRFCDAWRRCDAQGSGGGPDRTAVWQIVYAHMRRCWSTGAAANHRRHGSALMWVVDESRGQLLRPGRSPFGTTVLPSWRWWWWWWARLVPSHGRITRPMPRSVRLHFCSARHVNTRAAGRRPGTMGIPHPSARPTDRECVSPVVAGCGRQHRTAHRCRTAEQQETLAHGHGWCVSSHHRSGVIPAPGHRVRVRYGVRKYCVLPFFRPDTSTRKASMTMGHQPPRPLRGERGGDG